jgi:glyoxylase-like metal-dependent hydrolase (beta-lactamase superfamily II)
MIFRQIFDPDSSTYSYLIGDENSREALLIDSVLERTEQTLQLIQELDLKLVLAIDTHTHADHVTGLGALRDATGCKTMMGRESLAECLSDTFVDSQQLKFGSLYIEVIYSPGHTDDSYSFYLPESQSENNQPILFSGDTLLIRGTGRTDFQNGNAGQQYNSLFNRLLKLPDNTLVYPAHDYKGWMISSISEEKKHNPRLQVTSREDYIALMDSLDLPNPKMMDIAVPANRSCGDIA